MADFAALRRTMVDTQVRTADVTDRSIIEAMMSVERERFLPQGSAGLAYLDMDIPVGKTRRLLKPMVLARMLQALEIAAGQRALDVGCGTGYAAALLSHLGASVVALEEDEALAQQAQAALSKSGVAVVQGPLAEGHADAAPYDVILVEGRIELPPDKLCAQLAQGGRLICIQGEGPASQARLYRRDLHDTTSRPVFDATGPRLPGFAKPDAFVF